MSQQKVLVIRHTGNITTSEKELVSSIFTTISLFYREGEYKHMAEATVIDLDVRELIPRERHTTIFARFDALTPGETLRLVNDHDPKPLYYQLMAERSGMFVWEPEQQGPEVWVIRIRKTSPAS